MKTNMSEKYKELICGLLPSINDEGFLHEIYVELLMHLKSQEAQDGPSD